MLLEIGLSEDRDTLRRRLEAAASEIGFGLFSGALVRGDLRSGRAWVETVTNTPAAFVEAQRALGDALRDPALTRLSRSSQPITYDEAFYAEAGASDLWDLQAPFGYRSGIACAVHQGSHAEQFLFGVDGPSLPTSPTELAHVVAMVQLLTVHAHAAMQSLYTPAQPGSATLTPKELACLQWARGGKTVWQTGGLVVISDAETRYHTASAVRKLGAQSVAGAVLKCIKGGLIDGA